LKGIDHTTIIEELTESILVKQAIIRTMVREIGDAAELIITSYRMGGKVILFGNGGSAADAQHIAAELIGRFMLSRKALPAIALTVNTSILTAIANDMGFDKVFTRQIEALATERDVIIGISTSGKSTNIVKAIELAKSKGAKTIALIGSNSSKIVADLVLAVPSSSTPRIQEAHITIGHIICGLVEKELSK